MKKHGRITGGATGPYNDTPNINGLAPVSQKGESFPYATIAFMLVVALVIGILSVALAPLFKH